MFTRTRSRTLAAAGALVLCTAAAATAATSSAGSSGTTGAGAAHQHATGHGHAVLQVVLRGTDGSKVGKVTLKQTGDTVVVKGRAEALTPGFHGFHIHAIGICDPAAAAGPFTSAGGHYTGGDTTHGNHAGDMPPLLVMDDGEASAQFVTDRFGLAELRDLDGSAVMVHAGPDNLANIPTRYSAAGVPGPDAATLATGDAGARVACGVID
ncbi:superoxide dismutase family protein [Nocardioides euryhalodurans]|uniref:Superoxide dismutase [Cu-Zn] n=1 Tax=Nocardioides euryhalodurans TaxID=2518370 RepID=A0A4P7GHN7_9ACTN|nr:superoxide dismutase family protein [Nocardioides euryhalodurans]QBR91356.1 superoxide dismutase family protein [Nocardioides euryhalodurans]